MKLDKPWIKRALKDISTFGQIGFTIVVPPVVLCLIAFWLMKKFSLGYWIAIAGIILGLLSAFTSVYKMCRLFLWKNTKDDEKNSKISYRNHS